MENVYYPPTIREAAPSSSEVRDAPEEAEAAGPGAVLAITVPEEPTLLIEPLKAIPLGEGSEDLEVASAQLSKEGAKTKPKK